MMKAPLSIIRVATLQPKFKCKRCDEIHDEFEDAAECCNKVEEVMQCPVCLTIHTGFEAETNALKCCGYDPEVPLPVSKFELELAGQQRLPLQEVVE